MRQVLVALSGATPQVVTETLWCLGKRSAPPVHVDTLYIATTGSALAKVKTRLCGADGALARLARDWDIPAPKVEILVFNGPDGTPLEDIRSSAESTAFAAGIAELIRRLTMDSNVALHASISGGRKTMGFHLGHMMSLLGRPHDRLSHVMISPEFEECEDFWYPTPQPTQITNRHGETLDAATANVELTEIQYVRLRGRLTAHELLSAISDPGPLVRRVQSTVDEGIEAQTTLEIDAVMAGRIGQMDVLLERSRPLAPILSVLRTQCSLVLRAITTPESNSVLRFFIDCRARAESIEHARAFVQSLVSDLRRALDMERTGYRVVPCVDEPAGISPEWFVRLVPADRYLREPSIPRIAPVGRQSDTRAIRIGKLGHAIQFQGIPMQAIATSGAGFELSWSIERVQLSESEREAIETVHDVMARAARTMAGEVKYDPETTLPRSEAEAIAVELENWKYRADGFRTALIVRGKGPLPTALLAQIGGAAWSGRSFHMVMGDAQTETDPSVLDISDCFCAARLPPFDLPTPEELHSAGLPLVWRPAPRRLASSGIKLGSSGSRAICLSADDRARHIYVLGSTGTGKSTLLRNMILQDLETGEGVFVLDPHGDLFEDVLRHVPESRVEDVILLDAADVDYPFGLNFLEVDPDNRELSGGFAINELLAIFLRLYGDVPEAFGPMFEQYFRLVMMLLIDNEALPEPNLLDVGRVFADDKFRDMLRRGCRNRAVIDLMNMAVRAGGDPSWENIAPYITSKFNRLIVNPLLRNISCQQRSTVDFCKAMDAGRIILVRLPKGQLTEIDVRLLGMLVIGRLFGAALRRDSKAGDDRRPMHVYIDEFQNFVTETAGQMMAEGRKYGLRLTLANQTLAQLQDRMRDVVLGNAANLLTFRTGPADAAILEPFLGPSLGRYDLQALPNFYCAARILSAGAPVMPPFVMETEPPSPSRNTCASPNLLIKNSRERYARARVAVESEFSNRS